MAVQLVANGSIGPCRFVSIDTTADNKCTQATASAKIVGVSQRGTRNAPYGGLEDNFAALAGESLVIFDEPGTTAYLELAGTIAAGDYIRSDSAGRGVSAATGIESGAKAIQSGTSGKVVEVQLWFGHVP